jgi:hypothetical protein
LRGLHHLPVENLLLFNQILAGCQQEKEDAENMMESWHSGYPIRRVVAWQVDNFQGLCVDLICNLWYTWCVDTSGKSDLFSLWLPFPVSLFVVPCLFCLRL